MNDTETRQAAAVMIASETKNIQQRYRHGKSDDGWVDCSEPDWDWDSFEFRVAPEPESATLIADFDPDNINVTFADRDQAIESLCLKVFGAKPVYTSDQPPAPEPIEVNVWWHPEKGITGVEHTYPPVMERHGYTLRRATIHPEKP
jgi:hypothetical protein